MSVSRINLETRIGQPQPAGNLADADNRARVASSFLSGCSPNSSGTELRIHEECLAAARPYRRAAEQARPASRFMRSTHGLRHVFNTAVKLFARLAFDEDRRAAGRPSSSSLQTDGGLQRITLRSVWRNEDLLRRKGDHRRRSRVCSNRCSRAAKNF